MTFVLQNCVDWGIEEFNNFKRILNKSSTFQEQFVHPLALEHTIQLIIEFVYDNEYNLHYNIEVLQTEKKTQTNEQKIKK
jgi:hypothetical protein